MMNPKLKSALGVAGLLLLAACGSDRTYESRTTTYQPTPAAPAATTYVAPAPATTYVAPSTTVVPVPSTTVTTMPPASTTTIIPPSSSTTTVETYRR